MSKFVVTGGSGFIGSNMVDFLIEQGHDVLAIDNYSTGCKLNNNQKAKNYEIDLSKRGTYLKELFSDAEYVIHMAAVPNVQQSIEQPLVTHASNFDATLNVLEACVGSSIKKLIFSSTSAVYGNPTKTPTDENEKENPMSPYGLQKLLSEKYIKLYSELYGVNSVVLRYFNVFGKRMTDTGAYKSVISVFKESCKNKAPLPITNDGNQRRDFVNVDDVVKANYLACLKNTEKFEIFNIGYGENISVNEIADYFKAEREYVGKRIEPFETLCDNRKAKNILGWDASTSLKNWLITFDNQTKHKR